MKTRTAECKRPFRSLTPSLRAWRGTGIAWSRRMPHWQRGSGAPERSGLRTQTISLCPVNTACDPPHTCPVARPASPNPHSSFFVHFSRAPDSVDDKKRALLGLFPSSMPPTSSNPWLPLHSAAAAPRLAPAARSGGPHDLPSVLQPRPGRLPRRGLPRASPCATILSLAPPPPPLSSTPQGQAPTSSPLPSASPWASLPLPPPLVTQTPTGWRPQRG